MNALWLTALLLSQATDLPAGDAPEPDTPVTGPKGAADLAEVAAPAPASRRAAPPEVFREGLGNYYDGNFVDAAARMFDYVSTNEETAENRTWAQYFLGLSLIELGFSHGGVEHLFDVVAGRARPELLPDALEAIERVMRGPHDERLLDNRLIVDGDFGYLPPRTSGFVRFHQGLADLRAGRRKWALRLFESIPKSSAFAARARYALGVERLKSDQVAAAVKHFRAALAHPAATREVRNEARLALARILYERGEYAGADAMYRRVEVPSLTAAEGQVLLERAWTAYWRRENRKALGLLHALEAPSYARLHAPDKFLLRALIFKRLCHYIPAKRAVRRFRFAYGDTLDAIRRRVDLREPTVLRRAAVGDDPALARTLLFREALAQELAQIDTVGGKWRETGLDDALREIYRLAAARVDLQLDGDFAVATRRAAEDLIVFEEQMSLLDYEVGLAIYARIREERARRGDDTPLSVPLANEEAIYPFMGEYWNDELSRFDFLIDNRCFGTEED